jgi:hypothetical protein
MNIFAMHSTRVYFIKCLLLTVLYNQLISCEPKAKHSKRPSIYYWQTIFSLNNNQEKWLQDIGSKKLYVRLFDIDTIQNRNGDIEVMPMSILQMKSPWLDSAEFIPVIFITRNAMRAMQVNDNIVKKISNLLHQWSVANSIHWQEIQWDMDWTPGTKDSYFDLLRNLKKDSFLSTKTFSATIRLHQVKHQSLTGIPPVDKGVLMCYNMGNVKDLATRNSILDIDIAKEYLSTANLSQYPIPLDIVLPLFSWGVHFRNGKFLQILPEEIWTEMQNTYTFSEDRLGLTSMDTNMVFRGFTFLKGDFIRSEKIDIKQIKQLLSLLQTAHLSPNAEVLFFSLQNNTPKKFTHANVQEILDSF